MSHTLETIQPGIGRRTQLHCVLFNGRYVTRRWMKRFGPADAQPAKPKPCKKRHKATPRKFKHKGRILAWVYMPALEQIPGDEELIRLINLNNYSDLSWMEFMQEQYTYLGGNLPSLFPGLCKSQSTPHPI